MKKRKAIPGELSVPIGDIDLCDLVALLNCATVACAIIKRPGIDMTDLMESAERALNRIGPDRWNDLTIRWHEMAQNVIRENNVGISVVEEIQVRNDTTVRRTNLQ